MSIEGKLDSEIKESATFRGEVREYMKQTTGYIQAVSANQKATAAELKTHVGDTETAHGAAVREKSSKAWVSWVALGMSALVALLKVKDALRVR